MCEIITKEQLMKELAILLSKSRASIEVRVDPGTEFEIRLYKYGGQKLNIRYGG